MRILVFAYACEPMAGSEPGAGWVWARILSTFGDVWVITRANNRAAIEGALEDTPERDSLHFVYVDLPYGLRFWKRGNRGVRAYYLLWQVAALKRARKLNSEYRFDLTWHLTIANLWLGSLAALIGPDFVLGPVGGGVGMPPLALLSNLGLRGWVFEMSRNFARLIGRYANPISRLAWRRARLVLVQNPETRAWLPRRYQQKAEVLPHAVIDGCTATIERTHNRPPTALFTGRLIAWKGAALAIRALNGLPEWHLIICGEGPEKVRLERMANRDGLRDRVDFRGWLERDHVLRVLKSEADVFLFPSLHDDSPFAVAEAVACGIPVVCIDRGGPPVLIGPNDVSVPCVGGSRSLSAKLADGVARAVDKARGGSDKNSFETRLQQLRAILRDYALLDGSSLDKNHLNQKDR